MSAYSYTYRGPHIYTEPILRFVEALCRIGSRLDLPISFSMNQAPRESFYSENTWARVSKRIRDGKVWCLEVSQYPRDGFTMHTPFWGETLPFWAEIELVPERMPEKPPEFSFLNSIARGRVGRYPTSVSVLADLEWYNILRDVNLVREIAGSVKRLFRTSSGAYGYIAVVSEKSANLLSLRLRDSKEYVSRLDSVVPGVFPINLLSDRHIQKLGGKGKVMELFPDCVVEDLSDEEDRLRIRLVENIGDFDQSTEQKYRPLFSPILVEGKKSDES